jgi:CRISPR/Cas system-associated protein Cas5 (RAMP superfamily)
MNSHVYYVYIKSKIRETIIQLVAIELQSTSKNKIQTCIYQVMARECDGQILVNQAICEWKSK